MCSNLNAKTAARKDAAFDWSKAGSVRKTVRLLRDHGVPATAAIIASVIEDLYIRAFDRFYGVHTSGYIRLACTSLEKNQVKRGHRYRAVNAWAFKRVINALKPSKEFRFVDLGCGLGRACLIAADYGFRRVRGVEFVPEFCVKARANAEAFCSGAGKGRPPVEIRLEDAVNYTKNSDDDIVFLYNPFPVDVLKQVIENLLSDIPQRKRPALIIYSERVIETSRTLELFEQHESLVPIFKHSSWGQSFYVFRPKSK
jgi:SAM-dependent methyltransferase